jgi:pimeloyl-ACP methyl ester carboxylesterase
MKHLAPVVLFLLSVLYSHAQVEYPYPVRTIPVMLENKMVQMAFMDVKPDNAHQTVLLLHGKNFNGYYWKEVMSFLEKEGIRVVAPDQPGWGKSDKPDLHYSFHMLAQATRILLDSLQVDKAVVVGHSMGGMLATRFALLYPERVEKLVLENPIGLEDYRRFVPWQPLERLYEKEKEATYESVKQYQQTYYTEWREEYEQYVLAQAEAIRKPDYNRVAWVNALTYQMIYEQPVCYEWDRLSMPVLLIIGQEDRTVVGKAYLSEADKLKYGQYPELGKKTHQQITDARLVELPGVGHIPHIQSLSEFQLYLMDFIK